MRLYLTEILPKYVPTFSFRTNNRQNIWEGGGGERAEIA